MVIYPKYFFRYFCKGVMVKQVTEEASSGFTVYTSSKYFPLHEKDNLWEGLLDVWSDKPFTIQLKPECPSLYLDKAQDSVTMYLHSQLQYKKQQGKVMQDILWVTILHLVLQLKFTKGCK